MEVALIIPIYNRAKEFRNLLESLTNQHNFSEFYVIVIDDNSSEKEIANLCIEYEKKLHIKYFRNEKNIGPGPSRNIGLDWCQENNVEYVMFIDADDILIPGTIRYFLYHIKEYNADMVFNNFCTIFKDYFYQINKGYANLIFVFSKMYRLSAIRDLRFTDAIILEDLLFNLKFLNNGNKVEEIKSCNITPYLHIDYKESLTSQKRDENNFLFSQQYNGLSSILNFLNWYKGKEIEDPFTIDYIFSLYIIYEEGIISFPDKEKEFDELVNKILADKRVQNLYNNIYLYTLNSNKIPTAKQFCYFNKDRNECSIMDMDKVYFYKDSLQEFFKKHNFELNIDYSKFKKDNVFFAY